MTRICAALMVIAVLASGAVAQASTGTSFFGPTGLITMPTADSLGMGEFKAFANYVTRTGSDETPYGVNVGLGYGFEVGATRVHETGTGGGNENIVNAKWTCYNGNLVMPAVAVGALNVAENKDFLGSFIVAGNTGKIDPFAVATKKFSLPGLPSLSVSAGYIAGNLNKGMYGGSLQLTPQIELLADYVQGWSKFSFGARYNVASGISIQAADIDGDFAAGLAYSKAIGK